MNRHATATTGRFGGEGGWRVYSRRETMTRTDDTPTRRCVTCGESIEAEDFDELWVRYTDHQVREHGKPATVGDA